MRTADTHMAGFWHRYAQMAEIRHQGFVAVRRAAAEKSARGEKDVELRFCHARTNAGPSVYRGLVP